MDDIILQLDTVRRALGTLNIISSRSNLDVLLGSLQVLDRVITALHSVHTGEDDLEAIRAALNLK